MEKKIELKSTHAELLQTALDAHEQTDGAPIEVKDGMRVVRIGPWLPGIRKLIEVGYPLLINYIDSLSKNKDA